jgi:hypothetical protein
MDKTSSQALRGVHPTRGRYENGVRKVICKEPDGSGFGFGGGPVEEADGR